MFCAHLSELALLACIGHDDNNDDDGGRTESISTVCTCLLGDIHLGMGDMLSFLFFFLKLVNACKNEK